MDSLGASAEADGELRDASHRPHCAFSPHLAASSASFRIASTRNAASSADTLQPSLPRTSASDHPQSGNSEYATPKGSKRGKKTPETFARSPSQGGSRLDSDGGRRTIQGRSTPWREASGQDFEPEPSRFHVPRPSHRRDDLLTLPAVAGAVCACLLELQAAHAEGGWEEIYSLSGELRKALLVPTPPEQSRKPADTGTGVPVRAEDGRSNGSQGLEDRSGSLERRRLRPAGRAHPSALSPSPRPSSGVTIDPETEEPTGGSHEATGGPHPEENSPSVLVRSRRAGDNGQIPGGGVLSSPPISGAGVTSKGSASEKLPNGPLPLSRGSPGLAEASSGVSRGSRDFFVGSTASFRQSSSAVFQQIRSSLRSAHARRERSPRADGDDESGDDFVWLVTKQKDDDEKKTRRFARLRHDAFLCFFQAEVDACLHLGKFDEAEALLKEFLERGVQEGIQSFAATRQALAGLAPPLRALWTRRKKAPETGVEGGDCVGRRQTTCGGDGAGVEPANAQHGSACSRDLTTHSRCLEAEARIRKASRETACDMPAFSLIPFFQTANSLVGQPRHLRSAPSTLPALFSSSLSPPVPHFPPLDVWLLWVKTLLRVASFGALHEALLAAPLPAIWALLGTCLPPFGGAGTPPAALLNPLQPVLSLFLSASPPPVEMPGDRCDSPLGSACCLRGSNPDGPGLQVADLSELGRRPDCLSGCATRDATPFVFFSPFFFFRNFARLSAPRQVLVLEALGTVGLLCSLTRLHAIARGFYELMLLLACPLRVLLAKRRFPELPVAAGGLLLRLQAQQSRAHAVGLQTLWLAGLRSPSPGATDGPDVAFDLLVRGCWDVPRVPRSSPHPSFESLFLAFLPEFLESFWDRRRHRRLSSPSGRLDAVLDFADIQSLACSHSRLSRPLASETCCARAPQCRSRLWLSRVEPRESQEPAVRRAGSAALRRGFSFRHVFLGGEQTQQETRRHRLSPVRVSGTNDTLHPEGHPGSEARESVCTGTNRPSVPTSQALSVASSLTPRGDGKVHACAPEIRQAPTAVASSLWTVAAVERSLHQWRTDAADGGFLRGLLADPVVPFDRGTLRGLGAIRRRVWLAAQDLVLGPEASLSSQSPLSRRLALWRIQQEAQTARELQGLAAEVRGEGSRLSSASFCGPSAGRSPEAGGPTDALDGRWVGKTVRRAASTGGSGGRESVYASIRRALTKTIKTSLLGLPEETKEADENGDTRKARCDLSQHMGRLASPPHEGPSPRASPQASWEAQDGGTERGGPGTEPGGDESPNVLWGALSLADAGEEIPALSCMLADPTALAGDIGPVGREGTGTHRAQSAGKRTLFAVGGVCEEAARRLHFGGSLLAFLPSCALDARFVFSLHLQQLKEFESYRPCPFKRSRLGSLLALCCCRPGDGLEDPLKLYASTVVRDLRWLEGKAPGPYRGAKLQAAGLRALADASPVPEGRGPETTDPETCRGGARERGAACRLLSPKPSSPLAEASRRAARALEATAEAARREGWRGTGRRTPGQRREGESHGDKETEILDGTERTAALAGRAVAPADGQWGNTGVDGDGDEADDENGERAEEEKALVWGGGTRVGSAVINSLLAFLLETSELTALHLLPYAAYSFQSGERVLALRWTGPKEAVSSRGAPSEATGEPWSRACIVKCGVPGGGRGSRGGDSAGAPGIGVALPQLASLLEQTALLSLSSKFNESLMQRLLERLALTQFLQGNFQLSLAAFEQLQERSKSTLRSFEDADGVRLIDREACEELFGAGNSGRFSLGFVASVKATLLLAYLQRPVTAGLVLTEALSEVASRQRARVKEKEAESRGDALVMPVEQAPRAEAKETPGERLLPDLVPGASEQVEKEEKRNESERNSGGDRRNGGRERTNSKASDLCVSRPQRSPIVRCRPFRSLRPPSSFERDEAATVNLLLLLGQAALLQARQTRLFDVPPSLLPAEPLPCSSSANSVSQLVVEKETSGAPERPRGTEAGLTAAHAGRAGGGDKATAASPASVANKKESSGFLEFRFGDERKAEIATYPNLVSRAFRCGASALRLWGGAVDSRVWALLASTAMHAFDLPACAEFSRKALLLDRRDTRAWLMLAWCHSGRLPVLPPSHETQSTVSAAETPSEPGYGLEGQRQQETRRRSGTVPHRAGAAADRVGDINRASGDSVCGIGVASPWSRFPAAPVLDACLLKNSGASAVSAVTQGLSVDSGIVPFLSVLSSALEEHPTSLSLVIAKTWTQARHSPSFRLFSFGECLGSALWDADPPPSDPFNSLRPPLSPGRRPAWETVNPCVHNACDEAAGGTSGVSSVSGGPTRRTWAVGSEEPHGAFDADCGSWNNSSSVVNGDRRVARSEGKNEPFEGQTVPAGRHTYGAASLAGVSDGAYTSYELFWLAEERRHAALSLDTDDGCARPFLPSYSNSLGGLFSHACAPASTPESGGSALGDSSGLAHSPPLAHARVLPTAGAQRRDRGSGFERLSEPGRWSHSRLSSSSLSAFPVSLSLLEMQRSHERTRRSPSFQAFWGSRLFSVEATVCDMAAFFSAVRRDIHRSSLTSAAGTPCCFSCHAARHVHLLPCAMHALQRLSAELATEHQRASSSPCLSVGLRCGAGARPPEMSQMRSALRCSSPCSGCDARLRRFVGRDNSLSSVACAAASGDGAAAGQGLREVETLWEAVPPADSGDIRVAISSTFGTACLLHDCTGEFAFYEAARKLEGGTPATVRRKTEAHPGATASLTDQGSPLSSGLTPPVSGGQGAAPWRHPGGRKSPLGLGGVMDAKHIERETAGWMALVELLCHLGAASACVRAALQIAELFLHCLRGVAATPGVQPNIGSPRARSPGGPRRRGGAERKSSKRRDEHSSPRRRRHSSVGFSTKRAGRRRTGSASSWRGDASPYRHEADGPGQGHSDVVCQRCGVLGPAAAEELLDRASQLYAWSASSEHLAGRGDTPETGSLGSMGPRGTSRDSYLSAAPKHGLHAAVVANASPVSRAAAEGWSAGEFLGVKLEFLRLYADYFCAEEEESMRAEAEAQACPPLQGAFAPPAATRRSPPTSTLSHLHADVVDASERRHHSDPHSCSSSFDGILRKASKVFTGHEKLPSLRLSGFRRTLHKTHEAEGGIVRATSCWDEGLWGSGMPRPCTPQSPGDKGDTCWAEHPGAPGESVSFAGLTAAAAAALATGAGLSPAGPWRHPCEVGPTGLPPAASPRCLNNLLERVRGFRCMHPHSRPAQLLEARLLYRQRALGSCLPLLEGLVALDTQTMYLDGDTDFLQEALAAYLYGKCLQALGQFDKASRAFERAMRLYFNAPMMNAGLVETSVLTGPSLLG
ncbi:tetratricopeptide repeat-containing protein [Toxoplasma gondii RUB]|uniref:Tetratricopeptide repeat-containing protein n=1 Tax=Toxoplasma gondii RUB TaxID=935652 RepID=A0A086M8Q5_TOXGO|nr:tetratricopeptide repeat-containing protein [Toxoplasma gondii RUB]